MPANLSTVLLLILLTAGRSVRRFAPYVVGGLLVAALISYLARHVRWPLPTRLSEPVAAVAAALIGAVSPLPTMGTIPSILELRKQGLPAAGALAFALASSLMNPQLFVLTFGAFGTQFAVAQLVSAVILSAGLGLTLRDGLRAHRSGMLSADGPETERLWRQWVRMAEHIGMYFLVGVIIGASVEVVLPQLGVLNWLGRRGWLATPALGWLAAPFYACGGSAIPLASGLLRAGFRQGTLFTFLLLGPALRGTTLATIGALLPRRAHTVCLVILAVFGTLLGYGFDAILGAG
jgi:hypothetical protein